MITKEEIGIIAPNTSEQQAQLLAETIRNTIGKEVAAAASKEAQTISIGVGVFRMSLTPTSRSSSSMLCFTR